MNTERYFLQHFKHSRPYYTKAFVQALTQAAWAGQDKAARVVFDGILAASRAKGLQPEHLLEHNFFANETVSAQCMAQLELDGFPTYDIEPSLLEALANSDAGDMRLEDLRTPNNAYYLHWGAQPQLLLHGKFPVEGAFVFSHHSDWRVGLVARNTHPWLLAPERDVFQLRFPQASRALPFEAAVDLALQADLEDLKVAEQQLAQNPERQGLLQEIRAELGHNMPVLKEALRLVGNCIAYLTAYPDDSRFDWAPDTPNSLMLKMQRGGKELVRTASRLKSMGFIQVHRVGLDFLHSVEKSQGAGAPADAHGLRPHWRRGHWRHQAYGEKLALRKLIWVRPMRVLGGPAAAQGKAPGTGATQQTKA